MGDLESIQQQRGFPLQREARCRNTEKEELISGAQTFNRIAASTFYFSSHSCLASSGAPATSQITGGL